MKTIRFALLSLAALLLAAPAGWAEANYVYHERTTANVGAGQPYVSPLAPDHTQVVTIRTKLEYQFFTNQTRLYYTTDGTTPAGGFGTGSGTTQVVVGIYEGTFGGPVVDVVRATIPAQPAGTTVKYLVSAWHSGGGAEIFANGPGAPCGCGAPTSSSGLATPFTYTVPGLAPTVTTDTVTPVTTTTATLNATVNPGGLATSVQFYVDNSPYGLPINVPAGGSAVQVNLVAGPFQPGTMHSVYAYASNSQGNATGSTLNFTLLGGSPTAVALAPSPLTTNSATLRATVNPNLVETTVQFYYDNSPVGAPIVVPAGSGDMEVTYVQTGQPGSAHSAYAYASNAGGVVSSNVVFFTYLGGAPSATAAAPSPLTTSTATLRATVNPNLVETTVQFYYDNSPVGAPIVVPAGSSDVEVTYEQTGQPGSAHSAYAYATNAGGAVSSNTIFFSYLGGAPSATAAAPSPLTTSSATLRATVNPNLVETTVQFYYDFSPVGAPIVVPAGSSDVEVTYEQMGQPGSAHSAYAYASNAGGAVSSNTVFFTYLGGAPSATALTPSPLTTSSATLRATVNPNSVQTSVQFYYDFSPVGSPIDVPAGASDVEVTLPLTGQQPGSPHSFYAYATNAGGAVSSNTIFFTYLGGAPTVTTLAPLPLGTTTATLRASVNPNSVATDVTFYLNFSPVGTVPVAVGASAVTVSLPVSSLTAETIYSCYAYASNGGGAVSGNLVNFTTGTVAPEAETSVALLRGDVAPTQPPDAQFSVLRPPMINAGGHLAFKGTAFVREATALDASPITTANDMMIWADKGLTALALIAREGTVAPGTGGATFSSFSDPIQSANDGVTFTAKLKLAVADSTRDEAVFTDLGGSLVLVVRESDPVAGISGVSYKTFGSVAATNAGVLGTATLKGTVTTANDMALWTWAPGDSAPTVRLREGDSLTLTTGVTRLVKSFDVFGAKTGVTGQGRSFSNAPAVLVRVTCTDGSVANVKFTSGAAFLDTPAVTDFIVKGTPLISSPVPAPLAGATFATIETPAVNAAHHRTFRSTLVRRATAPIVAATDDAMIWGDIGGTLTLIAREGAPALPTASTFASFGDPIISDTDRVAFLAMLKTGVGGVAASSDQCVWAQTDDGLTLIGREGVPRAGLPASAVVNSFASVVINDSGGAFAGKLRIGTGGVTAGTDSFLAVWRASDGASIVVLREGDWLEVAPGHPRKLKTFDVFTPQTPFKGVGRSFNAAGQLAVYCTFIDGTTGIFVIEQ